MSGSPELTQWIVERGRALGFHAVGVVSLDAAVRYREYRRWLAQGRAGSMGYLIAPHQLAARRDPTVLSSDARSIIVAALRYGRNEPPASTEPGKAADRSPRGYIARYARGVDYHPAMRQKLLRLGEELAQHLGRPLVTRPCVDSAPLLERDLAELAGLGFVAKNTMLIAPGLGSYLVLGELLVDVELEPTQTSTSASHCGECRACLDACPTGAFPAAYELDARRCISYLTIEHRGTIDRELRPGLGSMIFGCDICQDVCPYNAAPPAPGGKLSERAARSDSRPTAPELRGHDAERTRPDLLRALGLTTHQLRRFVEGSALRRVNRHQFRRNVCVALGNSATASARPALERALSDSSPLVRGHAAWALGQLADKEACERALLAALPGEADSYVRSEIEAALAESRKRPE